MRYQELSCRIAASGIALLVLGLAGCATSTPTIDTSPEAEVTFDGLHEIKGGRADQSWARPGTDLTQYSKIMLQGAGIEYRPGGEAGRTWHTRSSGGPYEVTEAQKAAFREIVAEKFLEELGQSEHFTIVSEAGPDVLLIRGAILDVVSYVPPEPVGRVDIYLSSVGEATLVLELRDSITEAILARAVDRRAAESSSIIGLSESSRVSNTVEVRRLAGAWGRMLREQLDEFGAPKE
jgi:hypothetical protein